MAVGGCVLPGDGCGVNIHQHTMLVGIAPIGSNKGVGQDQVVYDFFQHIDFHTQAVLLIEILGIFGFQRIQTTLIKQEKRGSH
ncbi:MAG: hypothetical protein BWY72_01206 [Bacteroidetes bacterium ADurb.Bin416]|nr:MAG: hypothetical protein BWY72_01206 [Bacteroidetes bacterium ADurb.Bin416]